MAVSIQTNVNSLVAQENLRQTGDFQSRTIQRLTSGYRINSSADDAAGLAVANKFRTDVAELSQGVRNANDGVSQMQIMDGGITNISKMLDRMKTLATQSASSTFSGDRATVNKEFQDLVKEIDRQAANIGLNANGTYNNKISVYTGGAGSANTNATVEVDLSGQAGQVDSAGLALNSQNVLAGGTSLAGGAEGRLDTPAFTSSSQQVITINMYTGNSTQDISVTVNSTGGANQTTEQLINDLNGQLKGYGLSATVDKNGALQIGGGSAFAIDIGVAGAFAGLSNVANDSLNRIDGITYVAPAGANEILTISNGLGTVNITNTDGNNIDAAVAAINIKADALGVHAVKANGVISFQSQSSFNVSTDTANTIFTTLGSQDALFTPASSISTRNATAAIDALNAATKKLGVVQGLIGAGQNKLAYAIQLAQSQISNYSAAESRIRDADVAAEAANLTKAQVLTQASMAAMGQANSAPQQVLSLLKG